MDNKIKVSGVKEALAALDDIGQLRLSGLDETLQGSYEATDALALIRAALEAAEQEAEAWEAIEFYCTRHPHVGPCIFFDEIWFGNITDQVGSISDGPTRASVVLRLGTWCRAEMAK